MNPVDVLLWRVVGVVLLAFSAYGFLNAFIFRIHGPGADLGIVAGVLGMAALFAAQRMRDAN